MKEDDNDDKKGGNNGKLQMFGEKSPWNEELRGWLEQHIESHPQLTTLVLSRSQYTGVSRTALDQYLACTYFRRKEDNGQGVDPNKSDLERKVWAYRERIEGTSRHGHGNKTFMKTGAWFQIQNACQMALQQFAIVLVYGSPGFGKSRCLTQFEVQNLKTAPITIICSPNITTRYFCQKVAQALGLSDKPVTARLEDMIAEKLKRSPRLLLVDQANYLNDKALGTICYLWEIARIPTVLVGTRSLYDLFTTSDLTEDVRKQLSSRVSLYYKLEPLNEVELKALVHRVLGDMADDEMIAEIMRATGGNFRHLADQMLPRILALQKRNFDRSKIVARAASKLMLD